MVLHDNERAALRRNHSVVQKLQRAQEENGDSREYSGIHFRNSTVAGITQGEQIGRQAFAQYLQPYGP